MGWSVEELGANFSLLQSAQSDSWAQPVSYAWLPGLFPRGSSGWIGKLTTHREGVQRFGGKTPHTRSPSATTLTEIDLCRFQ
jgi:hypothetical protein